MLAEPGTVTETPPEAAPPSEEVTQLESQAPENAAPESTTEEPDPSESVRAAERRAEATKLANRLDIEGDFASVEDVLAEQERRAEEARRGETDGKAVDAVRTSVSDKLARPLQLKLENGETVQFTLSDEFIKDALAEFEGTAARDVYEQEFSDSLDTAALGLLPKDAHDAFITAAGEETDVKKYLQHFAESMAPNTKWARELLATREADLQEKYREGWEAGRKGKAIGTAGSGGNETNGVGKLTREQYLRMSREEQMAAWRERPDEVEAL